jgi:hypothetical protein
MKYSFQSNIGLSDQQYLDCVYEGYKDGCNRGWPTQCYDWTKNNGNMLANQKDYPYVARDGRCNTNVNNALSGKIKVEGYRNLLRGDRYLYAAVKDSNIGVLSVAVGAYRAFETYKSGVFYSTGCSYINHAVDVVGYGSQNGLPYFKVRNSWGTNWGEKGYIRMRRGPSVNTCGLCSYAHYPIVTSSSDGNNDGNDDGGDDNDDGGDDNDDGEDDNDDGGDDKSDGDNDGDKPRDCIEKTDTDGSKYRGTKSVTESGHACQRWDSQSPNGHSRTPQRYPNAGLEKNYCRNPDGEPKPWCFNGEGTSPQWEFCDIPQC